MFKLDKIARRLKALQQGFQTAQQPATTFDKSRIHDSSDRHTIGVLLRKLGGGLQECGAQLDGLMQECLTETLKFHVGTLPVGVCCEFLGV